MDIKKLTEALDDYSDVNPTQAQIDLAEKLADAFRGVFKELNIEDSDVCVDEKPCLLFELGDDYPATRAYAEIEEDSDKYFITYVTPLGTEEEIKHHLEDCPLGIQLYSEYYNWDEDYSADDVDKIVEKVKSELRK